MRKRQRKRERKRTPDKPEVYAGIAQEDIRFFLATLSSLLFSFLSSIFLRFSIDHSDKGKGRGRWRERSCAKDEAERANCVAFEREAIIPGIRVHSCYSFLD